MLFELWHASGETARSRLLWLARDDRQDEGLRPFQTGRNYFFKKF
jgi:hypothetical protein